MSQYDDLMQQIGRKLDEFGGSFRSLDEKVQRQFTEQAREIGRLGDELADSNKKWGARFASVANGEFNGGRPYRGRFRDAEQARETGKFLRAVALRDSALLAKVNTAAIEPSTGGKGGFLAGRSMIAEIINNVERYGVFERNRPFLDINTREYVQPKRGDAATIYFPDFGVAPTESQLTFKAVRGTLPRWSLLTLVDRWFLMEGNEVALAEYVIDEFSRALAQKLDQVAFMGNGESGDARIKGAFKLDPTADGVGRVTAASGDDTFQEVIDASVKYLGLAVGTAPEWVEQFDPRWYMHRTIFWAYMAVRDSQGRPIADIFNTGERAQPILMGYPVEHTQVAPKLSDTAVSTVMAIFAALKAGYVACRFSGGIEFDTLMEIKRFEGQVAMVADVLQHVAVKDAAAIVQIATAASS